MTRQFVAGSPSVPAEPSEEVRLALARLASGPVLARGGAALAPAAPDLAAAARHALADPCPDIIKACAAHLVFDFAHGLRAWDSGLKCILPDMAVSKSSINHVNITASHVAGIFMQLIL